MRAARPFGGSRVHNTQRVRRLRSGGAASAAAARQQQQQQRATRAVCNNAQQQHDDDLHTNVWGEGCGSSTESGDCWRLRGDLSRVIITELG